MEIELQVQRFNPETDAGPQVARYRLQVPAAATVLDALLQVAAEQDPGLAFRRMCRSGICGACGVAVGGRPVLACQAPVSEFAAGGALAVAPLPGFPVLRDLVVDLEPFFAGLTRALPWLVPNPAYGGRMARATVAVLEEPATCILCGVCAAGQPPAAGAGAGPAAWVKAFRLAHDPRDALGQARLQLMADLGLSGRAAADRLARVCPKQISLRGAPVLPAGQADRLPGGE